MGTPIGSATAVSSNSQSPTAMSLPPNETCLPQIEAEPWLCIDHEDVFLKGIAFDRNNDLIVMAAFPGTTDKSMAARLHRRLLRINNRREVTTLLDLNGIRMCDHAIHRDGRIFVACLTGELLVVESDGTNLKQLRPPASEKHCKFSDLTFDSAGNLHVTDFSGHATSPEGAVYRWSPDFLNVDLLMPNLVTPNGIAFTPDEKAFWVSCSWANEVLLVTLDPSRRTIEKAAVMYRLSGRPGADGIRVDRRGNVYLAVNFQGRVLIFNEHGIPIANVLMPGRDRGQLVRTSNVAFRPGTDEVFVVASGESGGAWIYKFRGLAEGVPLFSHQ